MALVFVFLGLAGGQLQSIPLPGEAGPWQGDLTWYDVGLGACGIWSQSSDPVCAVSHVVYDAAARSTNPNNNPLCQLRLSIEYNGKQVEVGVVDRCLGCKETDIDVSPGVFEQFANLTEGRLPVKWEWKPTLDDKTCKIN